MTQSSRVSLTENRIRAFTPPDNGEAVLWDQDINGFGVRCYPSGRKVFILYYRANGGGRRAPKRRMSLGEFGSVKLADARIAARRYHGQIAAGIDPQAVRKEANRRDKSRLDSAIDLYDQQLEARGVVNRKQITSMLRRELLGPFGKVDLASIDRQMVADRVERLDLAGQAGAAQDLRAKAATFFNWAANRGLVYASPLAGWRREKATRAQANIRPGKSLSSPEIKRIWRACGAVAAPYGDYVRILVLVGQRRKETALMRWRDLDLTAGVWTIPGSVAKNGREHRVPLPPLAVSILRRQKKWVGSPYVFAGGSGKAMAGWSKRHPPLVRESGVEFTLHDCRRTFRSGLTLLKVDPELAEIMLNHARGDLIERYDREPRWNERMAAATAWADHVANAVEDKTVAEIAARRSA